MAFGPKYEWHLVLRKRVKAAMWRLEALDPKKQYAIWVTKFVEGLAQVEEE